METVILDAIQQVLLNPRVIAVICVSATYGLFVGAIPGLTATMAVALIVPMTFFLTDVEAIAAIVTTVTCSIFAGDIPAALVRIPGTPASAAYANDAYAMTRQGKARHALSISLVFSVIGGMFGAVVLAIAAPQLAKLATKFTSHEYFWLYVLGLTCAAIVSDDSRLKGALALLVGLLLSAVGLGASHSAPRLTFGIDQLIEGVSLIPAMIGLFGVSEVLRNALDSAEAVPQLAEQTAKHKDEAAGLSDVLKLAGRRKTALTRSSLIGSIMGMLPGAGADIAAWISYAVSKRFSRNPDQYGRGSETGLADATGANNAALGSAWIPALVFGIPGDSVTAIAIGVLLMKNITPGPNIFDASANPEQATLVAAIFVTFIVANLLLFPLGMLAIRAGSQLVNVSRSVMLPAILVFCLVGAYALNASYFDVGVMIAMGLLGYGLEQFKVPLGPVVLGLILGGELESKLIQSLTKTTNLGEFFRSPICIMLAVSCVLLWVLPVFSSLSRKRSAST